MAGKRKKKKGRDIIFLKWVLILLIVALLSFSGYALCYTIFADEPMAADVSEGEDITVRINSGMSDLDAAKELKHSGLIANAYIFFAQSKIFMDSGASIQPGTYKLNTSMNAEEILEQLTTPSDEESSNSSEGIGSGT